MAVTCAARTVVDLGRVLERDDVEAALATALQRRLATVEEVRLWLQQAWRTAGTGLVRDVLTHFDPAWESLLSARLGRLLQQAGLDLVPGFGVRDPAGRLVAVADFACPRRRLLVEADGWAFHGSKEQQQADRERDRALLLLGWTTVRFTTHDVVREPARTVQELVRLLSRLAA